MTGSEEVLEMSRFVLFQRTSILRVSTLARVQVQGGQGSAGATGDPRLCEEEEVAEGDPRRHANVMRGRRPA